MGRFEKLKIPDRTVTLEDVPQLVVSGLQGINQLGTITDDLCERQGKVNQTISKCQERHDAIIFGNPGNPGGGINPRLTKLEQDTKWLIRLRMVGYGGLGAGGLSIAAMIFFKIQEIFGGM